MVIQGCRLGTACIFNRSFHLVALQSHNPLVILQERCRFLESWLSTVKSNLLSFDASQAKLEL